MLGSSVIMADQRTRSGEYVSEIVSVPGIVCSRKALRYIASPSVNS